MLSNDNHFSQLNPNNIRKKNILILPEYTENLEIFKSSFRELETSFNLIYLDWSDLYSLKEDLKFQNLFEYVGQKMDELNLDYSETIFIGFGIGATILQYFAQSKKPLGEILVSPIYSTTFVNPFTSNIPSYKDDLASYYIRLKKEYFNFHNFFIDKNDENFLNKYKYYYENKDFFDTVIAQISLYESLKEIREFENSYVKNTAIFFGVYDEVSEFKDFVNSKKFKRLNGEVPVLLFNQSSHHLQEEENNNFINKVIYYANKWIDF